MSLLCRALAVFSLSACVVVRGDQCDAVGFTARLAALKIAGSESRMRSNGITSETELRQISPAGIAAVGLKIGQRNRLARWLAACPPAAEGSPAATAGRTTGGHPRSDGRQDDWSHPYCNATGNCHRVPQRKWEADIYSKMEEEGNDAMPFLLSAEDNPIHRWPAIADPSRRWNLKYLRKTFKHITKVRHSPEEEYLYYIDHEKANTWLSKNAQYWKDIKPGEEDNTLSRKMLKWEQPHQVQDERGNGGKNGFAKLQRAHERLNDPDNTKPVDYMRGEMALMGTPYASAHVRKVVKRDFHPIKAIMDTDKDVPDQTLDMWVGVENVSTAMHYDTQNNVNVQMEGVKRWVLMPPMSLGARGARVFPPGHPSQGSLQPPANFGEILQDLQSPKAKVYEAILRPGDALAIPAYWLHCVRTLEGPAVALSYWRNSDNADAAQPNPNLLLQNRKLSLMQLRQVIISTVVGTLLGSPAATATSAWRVRCSAAPRTAQGARACVHSFMDTLNVQRWAPLLNFSHADVRMHKFCPPIDKNWDRPEAAAQRKKDGAFVLWPRVHKRFHLAPIINTFRHVELQSVIGTKLMEWVEQLCYTHIVRHKTGAGMRDCPFFLHDCFD